MKKGSTLFLAISLILVAFIMFLPREAGYIPENITENNLIAVKEQKPKRKK